MAASTFQSPEVLLSNLNRVALNLRGAISFLDAPELEEQLTAVMRRLFLAELLANEWVIAIGGSQGAGKTTLVRMMYDLGGNKPEDDWLPANEGRGECMPVLLLEEDGLEAPQGYVRCLLPEGQSAFCMGDRQVSQAEFRDATKGRSSDALLAVLKVPRRYFMDKGQAFLLLPGYERQHDKNSAWQDLMRQALIGAAGTIIVTDQTRLANAQQKEILRDMQQGQLSGTTPIVVISKSERAFTEVGLQPQLRATAGDVFEMLEELRDQFIFCSSTHPEHKNNWLPNLAKAMNSMQAGSGQSRQRQLEYLAQVLKVDLTAVLAEIQAKFVAYSGRREVQQSAIAVACLKAFDQAVASLKRDYSRDLKGALDQHLDLAIKKAEPSLTMYEGLGNLNNKIKRFFETPGERNARVRGDISSAWNFAPVGDSNQIGQVGFTPKHFLVLGKITGEKLKKASLQRNLSDAISGAPGNKGLKLLGYINEEGQDIAWEEPSETTRHDLAVLFAQPDDADQHALDVTKEFKKSIALIPALVLEYARIQACFPELVGSNRGVDDPEADLVDGVDRLHKDFSKISTALANIGKCFSAIFLVDIADGTFNSIPAILATIGIGPGTGVSVGLAGVAGAFVGGAILAACVHNQMFQYDMEIRRRMSANLMAVKDQHLAHYLYQFDLMMETVRDLFIARLEQRYHLAENLMRCDRIEKSLADMKSLKLDLQDQLGRSASAIGLVSHPANQVELQA